MNRRNFLKSLVTVCGAAAVCPGELLKTDPWVKATALRKKNAAMDMPKHLWMQGKDESYVEGEDIFYGIPYYFKDVPIYYQENLLT